MYRTDDQVRGEVVAVKVPLRPESRRQAREVLLELRAAAALRHEGFVQVLDADLDPTGVPYLVMEFADKGALADEARGRSLPWATVAPWVRQLFEALAYAHARGLVHRDVKLENVLLKTTDGTAQAKLADYGLTKVASDRGYTPTRLLAGTLLYMAPETFEEDAGLIHAGVDLYAMGVLMYMLLAGAPPWSVGDIALVAAKIEGAPPTLAPSDVIPPHVAGVVNRLLTADPQDRYELAADCLRALFEPDAVPPSPPSLHLTFASTVHPARRSLRAPPEPSPSRGAPPALAIVREPVLVGRSAERTRLWDLAELAGAGPVGAVLWGPPGSGRSRLCRWLTAGLEQVGAARTLHVRLDPTTAPSDALAEALRRFLVVGRADGDELEGRLRRWFRARGHERVEEPARLARWLDPTTNVSVSALDAREAAAQRIALVELVLRLSAQRGLVCAWVEERGATTGATQLAADLLRSAEAEPYPLLLLYDRADEGAPERLAQWASLSLGRLGDQDVRALLADLAVPVDQVDEVARRVGGNPARAVESARVLCSRLGALAGISLLDETEADVPAPLMHGVDDLGETLDVAPGKVALLRLRPFCEDDSGDFATEAPARQHLVKLLALLPSPAALPHLRALWPWASESALDLELALQDAAVEGLVTRDPDAVALKGTPMTEAAHEYTAEAGDARQLGVQVANHLVADPHHPPGLAWHAATLLEKAGQPARAVELLIGAAERVAHTDPEWALGAWEEAAAVLDAALPDAHETYARVWLGTAQAARALGQLDLAEEHLEDLDEAALSLGQSATVRELWASILALRAKLAESQAEAQVAIARYEAAGDGVGVARTRLLMGDVLARGGDREGAIEVFDRVAEEAAAVDADGIALWARWWRARCLRALGRVDAARELRATLERAAELGVPVIAGAALRELGNLALRAGRGEEAEALLRRSVETLDGAGHKGEAAATRISLGELARARGALGEARASYSAAFAVARAYGLTGDMLVSLLNLGIVELEMGRGRRAARRLQEIDKLLPPGTAHGLRLYVEALRVACLADGGAWDDAEDALEPLAERERLPPDPDLAWLLEHAGNTAREAGEAVLATEAWTLALGIAEALGGDVEARIRAAMARL